MIWVGFSIGMGLVAAVFRGTPVDAAVMIVGLIGISMPVFWLGEVVNLLTQSRFHDTFLFSWVPPLGYTPFTQSPFGWFKSLIFPWLTLSVLYIGIYARVLRSALVDAQEEDYVRTARAKGLTERRVMLRHALRTSLVAFVSLFGLDFGALVGGGALLTEVVFGLHGVGKLTFDSLQNLDLPVILATVMYAAFFIVLANAFEDARRGDRAASLLALIGLVNLPIIYFSVLWWNTLHQGSSVSFKGTSMHVSMLWGMLLVAFGFWMYAIGAALTRVRAIILERERRTQWVRELAFK